MPVSNVSLKSSGVEISQPAPRDAAYGQEWAEACSPIKTAKKLRNSDGRSIGRPFMKGDPRINRKGHPLGKKNYATLYHRVLEEYAESNQVTIRETELALVKVAFKKALAGKYPFWKDIMDRVYGKARVAVDVDLPEATSLREIQESTRQLLKHAEKSGKNKHRCLKADRSL